jgi:dihydrofolate synthase/folylpolyglutamate synthase
VLIFASLATKDTAGVLAPFAGLAQEIVAVPIPGDHEARDVTTIADAARGHGIDATTAASVEAALDAIAARDWPTPPRILICGSLYLAGEALRANGTIPS